MIETPSIHRPRMWLHLFNLFVGLLPGTLLAIYCINLLQGPLIEMEGLIPVLILTVYGFLMFLGGGILFVIIYAIRGRASFFNIGVGLGGLIMIMTYLFTSRIIPWL